VRPDLEKPEVMMLIGVPKEIKVEEYRVGLVPETVRELVARGHYIEVEKRAGEGAGIADEEYVAAGAQIVGAPKRIFERAELIVKVKEPLAGERQQLHRGQTIFTYLHLAPDRPQVDDLLGSGVTAIAYETVTDADGKLPLLAPMSKVAGRMAPQVAANLLQHFHGGRGILLGPIDRVPPANVLILGGGTVGTSAAEVAIGMGAAVTVVVRSARMVEQLTRLFEGRVRAIAADQKAIEQLCIAADVVIGAVLVPGGAAPKLISVRTIEAMKRGTILVDVSIDQGGCSETSQPTTHTQPIYVVDGVVHYCVANMPGAVPRTSTFALNDATRPFVLALADKGISRALQEDLGLRNGLNAHEGKLTVVPSRMRSACPRLPR
jgi:alanine dehydrogenase